MLIASQTVWGVRARHMDGRGAGFVKWGYSMGVLLLAPGTGCAETWWELEPAGMPGGVVVSLPCFPLKHIWSRQAGGHRTKSCWGSQRGDLELNFD